MIRKPFDLELSNPHIKDLRIFRDPELLLALLLGLLVLACVGGVALYANIKFENAPF